MEATRQIFRLLRWHRRAEKKKNFVPVQTDPYYNLSVALPAIPLLRVEREETDLGRVDVPKVLGQDQLH